MVIKRSKTSRSVLSDGSRSLGLLRHEKTRIIAHFRRTDLVICSHTREEEILSYSQINIVILEVDHSLPSHIPYSYSQINKVFNFTHPVPLAMISESQSYLYCL